MADAKRTRLDTSRKLNRRLHLREIKDDRDSQSETVGADLRAARLRMGYDLASVGEALHIKVVNLRAIEEGDFETLPGATYALGFVRSYANFVGLGPDECIRRFKAEMTKRSDVTFNDLTRSDEEAFPIQSVLIVAGVILLAALGWYVASLALRSEPNVIVDAGTAVPDVAQPVSEPTTRPTADPVLISGEVSAPTRTIGSEPGTFAPIPLPEGEGIPQGTAWGTENHDGHIRLRAREDVWLRLESNERVLFERSLAAGDSYQPPNETEVIVVTRNAGALDLFVDGTYFGPIGKSGAMVAGLVLRPDELLQAIEDAKIAAETEVE